MNDISYIYTDKRIPALLYLPICGTQHLNNYKNDWEWIEIKISLLSLRFNTNKSTERIEFTMRGFVRAIQ